MGWWSPTILGGDDPLDAEAGILTELGMDEDDERWEDQADRVRGLLNARAPDSWNAWLASCARADARYGQVAAQVLALVHITVGATLPPDLKAKAIDAKAIDACEHENVSTWRRPEQRRACLDAFSAQLHAYDGTPTAVLSEGLFDRLADALPTSPSKKARP